MWTLSFSVVGAFEITQDNPIWIFRDTINAAERKHFGSSPLQVYFSLCFFLTWLIRCKKCVAIHLLLYMNMYTAKLHSTDYKVSLLLTLWTSQEAQEIHIYSVLSAVMKFTLKLHARQGSFKKSSNCECFFGCLIL